MSVDLDPSLFHFLDPFVSPAQLIGSLSPFIPHSSEVACVLLSVAGHLFNIFNSSTVRGRQYDVTATGTTGFSQPLEIMNPRLIRFGARIQF